MRKFKNFSLLRKTSKLYSENDNLKIIPKLQKNTKGTFKFLSGDLGHFEIVHTKDINTESQIMRNESDYGNQKIMARRKELQENPMKKLIILYRPLVDLDIFNFQKNFNFNYNSLCTEWNRFVMKNGENNNCTAVVPWLYNSRALIPYNIQPSNLIFKQTSLNNTAPELPNTFKIETSEYHMQDPTQDSNENYDYWNSSKFAMSLIEILEETKDAKGVRSKNDIFFDISRNCKSCPAVMEVKKFSSKFIPKRKESKVLLLSCHNFEKFERTFTRLLAKDKIRSLKPLFKNFENQDQVMTKLERAFVNHKMRKKNKDVIKRNVIMLQSNLIENMKEQLDFNEDSRKNDDTQNQAIEMINLNISKENVKKEEKPSNIMIVNDEIFKGLAEERMNCDNCNISEIRKQNIIYLNNSIFKELNKDEVNKILSRPYTSYKNEDPEIFVRIPTRHVPKKLKSLRPNKECDEYDEIPLENLIAVVAEKKGSEYVQRSKMCWQVFKEFEETMQKAKILNFPSQDSPRHDNKQKKTRKFEKHECNNSAPPLKPRTQKRSTRGKEENEEGGSKPKYTEKDSHIKATPNKSRARSDNILKPKINDKPTPAKFIEITREPTLSKVKTKKTKSNNKSKTDIRSSTFEKVGIRNVNMNISTMDRSIERVGSGAPSTNNKKSRSLEKNKMKDDLIKPQTTATTKPKMEKLTNLSVKKAKPEPKHLMKKKSGRLKSIWKKNCTPKKEMEEFINLKKNRNLSLKQQHLLLKEDESPVIEVLHKNTMKSPLSSSQSEFIGDLIETPKKKKVRRASNSLDKFSRKIMGSKDLADETETQLIIEELLASSFPPGQQKTHQHTAEKPKSKIPILGTPTTIKKQIEKVVATALATRKIREKFDENESLGKMTHKKEKFKNKNRPEEDKIKSGESEEDVNLGRIEKKFNSEQSDTHPYTESKKEKSIYTDSKKEMKEIEKDNRLQIDEILAMTSTSIHEKINQQFKHNPEMKKEKQSEQVQEDISEELEKKSSKTENHTKNNETDRFDNGKRENDNPESQPKTLTKCVGIQQEFSISSSSTTTKTKEIEEKGNQTIGTEGETGKNEKSNSTNAALELREAGVDSVKGTGLNIGSEQKFELGFEKEGASKKEVPEIKNQSTEIETFTENLSLTPETCSGKDDKQRGKNTIDDNSHGALHKKDQVNLEEDSNSKKVNITKAEINEWPDDNLEKNRESLRADMKSTDEGYSRVPDNEDIRRKRLIYFGKKMKKSSHEKEIFRCGMNKSRSEVEKTNKRNLSKPEIFIANNSSNIEQPTDADNFVKLPIKEHIEASKTSLSQYEIPMRTQMSEKSIETECNHKNSSLVTKNEIQLTDRQKTADHKIILKESVSDNVIIIKSARRDSKETVKSTQSVTKSILKQVQRQLNFLMENCKPKLNNQAVKRCREIAVKLRKSHENLMRNVPANVFKIYQEAKRISDKLSNTNIIAKTSQEIISKFTNTYVKRTTDSGSQIKLKETRKLSYKPENKIKSVIENKVTTKMKLLRKSSVNKNKIKRYSRKQDEKISTASKGKWKEGNLSPSTSISDMRNRSIGSLFADTVASALAKCGDMDKIMSKYSDSQHKLTRDRKINKTRTAENVEDFSKRDENKVVLQKEDEFLMSDGVRKLVFHVTLEKNDHKTNGEEWKCFSKAVLVKKSDEDRENQFNKDNQTKGSTEIDDGIRKKSKVQHSVPDESGEYDKSREDNAANFSRTIFNTQEEAEALQKAKEDLTTLKMLLQKERAKTEDDNCNSEDITECANFKMYIQDKDVPKSLEDLHRDIISDRLGRSAEGSTPPPPPSFEDISSDEEKLLNIECSNHAYPSRTVHLEEKSEDNVIEKLGNILENKNNFAINSKHQIQKYLKLSDNEVIKETIPEVFVTPLSSNTDLTKNPDQLEVKPLESLKVSELLPLFDKKTALSSCGKTDIDQSISISNVTSEKSTRIHPEEQPEKLTRKEEIERSCKLSNHPNSLVCRERKNIVKTILDKCETLEQKVENVLRNGNKVENLKEIYTDLERMGNCILKTVSSKDELSKETCTVPKVNANMNPTRTFATAYSSKSYSRFRDRKAEGKEKKKKEEEDFKVLEEIHGEALENEMYFGTESKRYKKDPQNKAQAIKAPKKNSIYHEIVRMSELNDFEINKSKEIGEIHEKSHFIATDNEQRKLQAEKTTKLDDIETAATGPLKHNNLDVSPNSKSKTVDKEQEETFLSDDTVETVVFEVKTTQISEESAEQTNVKDSGEKIIISETAEILQEKQSDNFEKGDSETSGIIQDVVQKDEGLAGAEMTENNLPIPRKHKILEKFAAISQEPDSPIFRINDELTFDRAQKRFEKMTPKTRRSIPKTPTSKRDGEPRMILRLSPSKELYTPPKSKKSDIDLKKLLLENPKALMQIASEILSKNQYLKFLMELRSTKELKEYWMTKIKEGIASSKTLNDLIKVINYMKVKTDQKGAKRDSVDCAQKTSEDSTEKIEHSKESEQGYETENRPVTRGSSGSLSNKSDLGLKEDRTSLELEMDNQKPKTGQSNLRAKRKKMLKNESKHDASSRRNISFQHKDTYDHPEFGSLPYTLAKYLDSPLRKDESSVENSLEGTEVSNCFLIESIDEKRLSHEEKMDEEENEDKMRIDVLKQTKYARGRPGNILSELKNEQVNYVKKENKELETNKSFPTKYERNNCMHGHQHQGVCHEKICCGMEKISEASVGNQRDSDGDVNDKKEQQTAIVLPGREPIKISLISEQISGFPASSMKAKSVKNALDNLSDVLSNCSSPVSSLCSDGTPYALRRRTPQKPGFKRSHRGEILQRNSTYGTNSENIQKPPQRPPTVHGLNLKKIDNPLKKFVRNHDEIHKAKMTEQMSNIEDSPKEDRKIRVIKTKSLSEVLKEDPNILKKFRQRTMVDVNADQTEEATKKFEYRFHDFRRKEDKCLEINAKRQEEQKKDLLEKFKCLIQARKVATERTRQNMKPNENQPIQPKVFSKILEKINYFKELEDPPDDEKRTITSDKNSVSPKEGLHPKTKFGNRRFLHTKRKQVNEDELLTWVQEHPAAPGKNIGTGNEDRCDAKKQNIIHIPWTPTCEVDAKN
ncbi:uncharacterized protein LOC123309564 [Coccinella septempunctata]|uniref:uncharacterized protein LOC123309564 n=1 Tax=Coccinella septempunctata TaxID=41139 RepID=UPI001D075C19|nr:uncharacterized protein LOC123309564 [Coccinella septempunctata]